MVSLLVSLSFLIGYPLVSWFLNRRWERWRRWRLAWIFWPSWFTTWLLIGLTMIAVELLSSRLIAPPTLAAANNNTLPAGGNCGTIISPYIASVAVMSQGAHGQDYGHAAVDLAAGRGEPVIAPISGTVMRNGIGEYGNSILVIENECYVADLWHGDWDYRLRVGQQARQGQPVGVEGNNGYTMNSLGQLCFGRPHCGNHTHLNVRDKRSGRNVDLSHILAGPIGAGPKPLRISWYDPSLCPASPINCWGSGKRFRNGEVVTAERYGDTAACIREWFGRTVVIPELNMRLVCRDTGGKIVEADDYIWIDILARSHPGPPYIYNWWLE